MPKFRQKCTFAYFNHLLYIKHQTHMSRFSELKELVMSLEGDFEKFYDKQNQAAGTRVRKGMQDLKVLAQDIRSEVQNKKNDKED